MRFVYAHFPINANITDDKKEIQIRNYLGERVTRRVPMLEGVTVHRSEQVKDEICLQGNDIEKVAQSGEYPLTVLHTTLLLQDTKF
jgi:large subunit ribosomal protein L9e